MEGFCFIGVIFFIGVYIIIDGYRRLKRGRGGKITKEGKNRIIWGSLFFGLALLLIWAVATNFLKFIWTQIPSTSYSGEGLIGLVVTILLLLCSIIFWKISQKRKEYSQESTPYTGVFKFNQALTKTQKPTNAGKKNINRRKHLSELIKLLDDRFNEEELKMLCFQLEIDYDNLPSSGKVHKARELVDYLERRNRLPELITSIKLLRPEIILGRVLR